jgi:endonuclease/exonuclease/phosphatase family metal-dependent hydrolase
LQAMFRKALLAALWVLVLLGIPSAAQAGEAQETTDGQSVFEEQAIPGVSAVQWLYPPGDFDVQILESWRKAVGPPSVIEAAPSPERMSSESLVIVSWNAHVGGGNLAQLILDLQAGRLTGRGPVSHFALLLQEVFRQGPPVPAELPADARYARDIRPESDGERRVDIVETARAFGLALYYVPSVRNGKAARGLVPEDRGNAILSTETLSSLTAVELPFERQRRVALAASLSGETSSGASWTIRLINTHFENRARWQHFFKSFGSIRLNQARALLTALPPGEITVLGGDLNTWFGESKEPAVRYVEQFFHRPPGSSESKTLMGGPVLPDRMVDYLFFRTPETWRAEYERADLAYGSDHYPLIGRVLIQD